MSGFVERLRFALDHRRVPGRMSAYLDWELGTRERARVEHHAGRCPQCRRVLNSLRATVALLRAQPPVRAPAPVQFVSAVRAGIHEPGG